MAVETAIENLQVGDIIQLSFDGVKFSHSLLVTAFENGEALVSTHSFDSLDRALSSYTFERARGLHVLGGYDIV